MRRRTVKELMGPDGDLRPVVMEFGDNQSVHCQLTEYRVDHTNDTVGKYLYDIRHSDDDWCEPATIEPHVLVNWFGTLICDKPISFGADGYYEINNWRYEDNE